MTMWSEVFGGPAFAAGWLATYAIHSTLLLGAAAVVCRVVRAEAWREVLWKGALVGSVVSPLALALARVEPVGGRLVLDGGRGAAATVEMQSPRAPREDPAPAAVQRAREGGQGSRTMEALEPAGRPAGGAEEAADLRAGAGPRLASVLQVSPTRALVWSWLLVALALLGRLALRRRSLFVLLAGRRPVGDGRAVGVFEELTRLAGLRRAVRLTSSPHCPLPLALSSSEVCVPERFMVDMDAEQQRGALAHEVAHLARRDPAWLLAAMVVESVFFFQPLNVLARRRLKESAEYLCDDWAARHGAGMGLARCLAAVAGWLTATRDPVLSMSSAMAEGGSGLIRRVERLLAGGARRAEPTGRAGALAALLVLVVAGVAPAVSVSAAPGSPRSGGQETVVRAPRPADPLAQRWRWAQAEASSRARRGYWVVYSIERAVEPGQHFMSDSRGLSFDRIQWQGTPLTAVLGGGEAYGGGTIALMFHFRSAQGDAAIDRIAHRSMSLPMEFEGAPVYWLGSARDQESVPWLDGMLSRLTQPALQEELVDGLALHPTSTLVLPVLARVLNGDLPERVRAEAVEGLEYHATPASLQLARDAARNDASLLVRREAAEALGGIHVAGAVAALAELALDAEDAGVRQEAAEALGDHPAAEAVPALARVIFEAGDTRAQAEAVEALGAFTADDALPLLRRVIWEHAAPEIQREAVETLADVQGGPDLSLLAEILERHDDRSVREEALDVLASAESPGARRMLEQAATRAAEAGTRAEAVQLLVDTDHKAPRSASETEAVAALLERVVFDDPDAMVQEEAVDAIAELPRDVARRLLRKIADTHPRPRVRREALDALESVR